MSGLGSVRSFVIGLVLLSVAIVWAAHPLVLAGLVAGELPVATGAFEVADADFTLERGLPGRRPGAVPMRVRLWYPVKATEKLPLVIYGPAWGGVRSDDVVLPRELASRGFAVLAYDDIAHDPKELDESTADAAARALQLSVTNEMDAAAVLGGFDHRVELQAFKVIAVLDALDHVPPAWPRTIAIDPGKIGAMGASFGGAAAIEAALRDPRRRIRAVVNLDGWFRGLARSRMLDVPLLAFNSTRGDIPVSDVTSPDPYRRFAATINAQDLAIEKRQLEGRADTTVISVRGAAHSDFMDQLYDRSRWKQWRPWRLGLIRPSRMRSIVDSYVTAFFDAHLNGRSAPLLRQVPSPFAEAVIEPGAQTAPAP